MYLSTKLSIHSTFLHTHLYIYLSIHPSIHLSTYLSFLHTHLYIYLSIHPSIHLSTYLSIHPPIYPPTYYPSTHPFTHQSIYLLSSISQPTYHLRIHPSIHPSIRLPTYHVPIHCIYLTIYLSIRGGRYTGFNLTTGFMLCHDMAFAIPWIPLHIHGFHWMDKDFFPPRPLLHHLCFHSPNTDRGLQSFILCQAIYASYNLNGCAAHLYLTYRKSSSLV